MKFSCYLLTTILSSLGAILFFVLALVYGRIDKPDQTLNNLTFLESNDSTNSFTESLISRINSAKSSIKIVSRSLSFSNSSELDQRFLNALRSAHERNVYILAITSSDDLPDFIECKNVASHFFMYGITSDLIIFDDIDVLFPGSPLPSLSTQIGLLFEGAPSVASDANAFVSLGEFLNTSITEARHFPHSAIVYHNTQSLHDLGTFGKYSFIQSQGTYYTVPPIREHLENLINYLSGIRFTKFYIHATRFIHNLGSYSYYTIQSLLYNIAEQGGDVRILLPESDPNIDLSLKWASTIASHENIHIHTMAKQSTNSFIIADDYFLLGSHPLSDNVLYSSYGLHVLGYNSSMLPKFNEIFEEDWRESKPFHDLIDRIWN
ncbi:hypothetical protein GPJ56_001374 [Histomonas meleagridis]|uniref:uncharacterized protein n=1 Tax=Histomonas meleagridis TaxID=135588 RepID=UPI003559BE0A|nr:hypothetical protein GPJ56_001374 [Histomonas meleagridis]KAH0798134.1 hypothetical protein GO595_008980 [Histomonas meleagridis]